MKSLITALVLSAASVIPVSAGIHDFSPENTRPAPRAAAGQGQCLTTRDRSEICYVKTTSTDFSIAIRDIDYPGVLQVAHIDCTTGRWYAFGDIPKATLKLYLDDFCPTYG